MKINFKRNFTIIFLFSIAWLLIDLDYDYKNQNESLRRMMYWSRFSASSCLNAIGIAATSPSLFNLDGKNCPQIREMALKKNKIELEKRISLYGSIIKNNEEGSDTLITFIPADTAELSMYNNDSFSHATSVMTKKEIENDLNKAKKVLHEINDELSNPLRIFYWWQNATLEPISYTAIKYEILQKTPDDHEKKSLASVDNNTSNLNSEATLASSDHDTNEVVRIVSKPEDTKNLDIVLTKQASTPSFDCSKAKTYAEMRICESTDLAEKDRNLFEIYSRTLSKPEINKNVLKNLLNDWRINYRDKCTDIECIDTSYDKIISDLKNL